MSVVEKEEDEEEDEEKEEEKREEGDAAGFWGSEDMVAAVEAEKEGSKAGAPENAPTTSSSLSKSWLGATNHSFHSFSVSTANGGSASGPRRRGRSESFMRTIGLPLLVA